MARLAGWVRWGIGMVAGCVTWAGAQPAESGSTYWRGREVSYTLVNGRPAMAGDMLIEPAPAAPKGVRAGLTVSYSQYLWPAGSDGVVRIPYVVSNAEYAAAAVATFNAQFAGKIQWVPRTEETDYVDFALDAADLSQTCQSYVGRVGGRQTIVGSLSCIEWALLHEMGHAMGLLHEHQREDLATWVATEQGNVDRVYRSNFDSYGADARPLGGYDYLSLMHYGPYAFSKNRYPVYFSVVPGIPFGESRAFSPGDEDQLLRLYGFAPAGVTISTNPQGLPIVVDGATYTAPHRFTWAIGSTHTIAASGGTADLGGAERYRFANWSDGGAASHTITVTAGNGTTWSRSSSPATSVYQANYARYCRVTVTEGSEALDFTPKPEEIDGLKYVPCLAPLKITAVPPAGKMFHSWSSFNRDWGGAGLNPRVEYPSPGWTIGAHFVASGPIYRVEAAFTNPAPPASPQNATVSATIDGADIALPVNFTAAEGWTPGSSHTVAIARQTPASSAVVYDLNAWSDGGAALHTVTASGTTTTWTASMTPSYWSLSSKVPATCESTALPYAAQYVRDGATLTAIGAGQSPWTFAGFGWDLSGTATPTTVTVHDQIYALARYNTIATPLTVTGLSRAAAPQGVAPVSVTLYGTGFTTDSLVFVNGRNRVAVLDSPTELRFDLEAEDVAEAASLRLQVENQAGNCYVAARAAFAVGTAAGITAVSGGGQRAAVLAAFATPLTVRVRSAEGTNAAGAIVTFTAPATGASGTFAGAGRVASVAADSSGTAVSPTFTANGTAGGPYAVTAEANGLATSFLLTNAKGAQSITFAAIAAQSMTAGTVTVSPTASSGLAVSLASLTPAVCTVSGLGITLAAAGTCTVQATQSGDANWSAAAPVSRSFTVSKAAQTITFPAPADRALNAGAVALGATASSGLAVSYSTSTPAVCAISGTAATPLSAGTCTVTAAQAGNNVYAAATSVTRSFTVTAAAASELFPVALGWSAQVSRDTAANQIVVRLVAVNLGASTARGVTVSAIAWGGTAPVSLTQMDAPLPPGYLGMVTARFAGSLASGTLTWSGASSGGAFSGSAAVTAP